MKLEKRHSFWINLAMTAFVVFLVASTRWLPHPWNFTPVGAVAIFGGIYMSRGMAFLIPLTSMFVADLIIGVSWPDIPFVYGSLALAVFMGAWIQKDYGRWSRFIPKVLGGTLMASVIFYIITNFGSWLILPIYSKDISGLMQSYTMAIPFFKYSLAGDLFYLAVSIGIYESATRVIFKTIPVRKETI